MQHLPPHHQQATADRKHGEKMVVQYVVKLTNKYHDENLPAFVEALSKASYSRHSICDSYTISCSSAGVSDMEVGDAGCAQLAPGDLDASLKKTCHRHCAMNSPASRAAHYNGTAQKHP